MTSQRDVSVVIPVFGDLDAWLPIAEKAATSVAAQTVPTACTIYTGSSLADARNAGLADITTPYVVFLDADDLLAPDYIEHMLTGQGQIRWPSVERDGTVTSTVENPLPAWNHIVIGAMANTQLLRDLDGFRDLPILEDYDLWCRAWDAGADMRPCLDAVYCYRAREGSKMGSRVDHDYWWHRIRDEHRVK